MIHFGIICPPYPGHLNPLSALGRELQARGHRVTILQVSDLELKIRSEGLEFYPVGKEIYERGSLAASFKQLTQYSGVEALNYSVAFCRHITEIICQDVPSAIQNIGIEALLVDQLEPVGQSVAQALEIPFVCISSGQTIHRRSDMPPFFTSWRYCKAGWARLRNRIAYQILDRSCQPILQVINRYRQQWKLPPYRKIYESTADLHISQQPAAFEFPIDELPDRFHYTGPFRNASPQSTPFPYEQLTGQPVVYASLGSVQNTKQEIFHCIAAACQGLDVQLVITHGGGMSTAAIESLLGSPLVVEYAPQLDVLAKASLTITHGGMNTVLDSLSLGVPIVAIPITFEQPGTGERIRWTGTGEVLSLSQLSVSELRTAIQRVLADETYLRNAQKLQQAIQQGGGVKRAGDLVEQAVISERYPIISNVATDCREVTDLAENANGLPKITNL